MYKYVHTLTCPNFFFTETGRTALLICITKLQYEMLKQVLQKKITV